MTTWEYCILTRLSAGLDTKWYVNRVFQHRETELPEETTQGNYQQYNALFDELHAAKVYPILPAVLNLLGADGWELIDDMNTGITGGEGLVFKRPAPARRAPARKAGRKAAGKTAARKATRARR
jgi:hypothetical protein